MRSYCIAVARSATRFTLASFFAAVFVASIAHADLPLTIEDLLTDKGKIKLDLSLAYANSDRRSVSVGEPIFVQTGPTSFVPVPTVVGDNRINSDTTVATLGLRYGLTPAAEIYARGSYLHSSQRLSGVSGKQTQHESGFTDAWAGLNYLFSPDTETPALLGFAEIALREKRREVSHAFKSALIGGTTNRAIDPVVLVLTAAYRFNTERSDGNVDVKPGNFLLLSPSIAFAVNDRVTLTTGFQWINRQADRVDGQTRESRQTSTDLTLGAGYGIDRGNTLNLTVNVNASGRNGADLRLNWLRTF